MWWYNDKVDGVDAQTVALEWRREEATEGEPATVEQFKVAGARWSLRSQSHFLTYEEHDATTNERTRTTLRIEPEQMTLIRHGEVRWNHTFRAGHMQTSTMYLGSMVIPLQIDTQAFEVEITECGGRVVLQYQLSLAGESQDVKLMIQFGNFAEN